MYVSVQVYPNYPFSSYWSTPSKPTFVSRTEQGSLPSALLYNWVTRLSLRLVCDMLSHESISHCPSAVCVSVHGVSVQVLICVFGADVNAPSTSDELPPLHIAVNSTHPRIVR